MDGTIFVYGIGLLVGLAVVALIYGSIAKTDWGINFSPVNCPRCQTAQAFVRKPADGREAKWGGYTCSQCGTKMDKWGRVRGS
jgi:hypothetical protein